MADRIQDLLQQLASTIGPADGANVYFVSDGNLLVAYDEGVRNYLMQCVAAVLITQDQDRAARSRWVGELLPEVARRLDANEMLFPADISGADLGLALCALGANPFIVKRPDDIINMDSVAWKFEHLLTLSNLYTPGSQSGGYDRVIKPIPLPPPPADNPSTRRLAQLPAEFLVMVVRMLNDVGLQLELIQRVIDSSGPGVPDWVSGDKFARGTELSVAKVKRIDIAGDNENEVLFASFVYTRAVSALLRAAIAVDFARQHAQNPATLAALPVIKSWAIHKLRADDTVSSGTVYFSCVASKPRPAQDTVQADTSAILPLAIALEEDLHVWPSVVPDDMAWQNVNTRQLTMRLGAFLSARVPMLPTDAAVAPRHSLMWYQRRDARSKANPTLWFVFQSGVTTRPQDATAGPYSFRSTPNVVSAMETSASIDARLDANPFCRKCGLRLDVVKARASSEKTRATLYCGRHRQLAVDADDE